MCKVPCFHRCPTPTVRYGRLLRATLFSKGPPTAVVMCKYFAFKGTQSYCEALFFQRSPQLHWFLVLHISILGPKLSLGRKWWRDWILGPCDSVGSTHWGYGVQLIRLWVHRYSPLMERLCRLEFLAVSDLARNTFCVMAASDGRERVFSMAGHVVNSGRTTLKSLSVNNILLFKSTLTAKKEMLKVD